MLAVVVAIQINTTILHNKLSWISYIEQNRVNDVSCQQLIVFN